jgi:hypothetical protein
MPSEWEGGWVWHVRDIASRELNPYRKLYPRMGKLGSLGLGDRATAPRGRNKSESARVGVRSEGLAGVIPTPNCRYES